MPDLSNAEMPDEFWYRPTESGRKLYRALWAYLDSEGIEDWEGRAIVAFTLVDGDYCFSLIDPLDVLLSVVSESAQSDRLLVIVSVAYLEDQIRLLLSKYLADDEVSVDLLDPNRSMLASLVPMANLAFSMGLLAKEWLDILKRMARLRNMFAHLPLARSFEDLSKIDAKAEGLFDSLQERYKQLTNEQYIDRKDIEAIYIQLFQSMYNLTQYAIDHIATPHERQLFDDGQIIQLNTIQGMSKADILLASQVDDEENT